jgi:hypothetical protein
MTRNHRLAICLSNQPLRSSPRHVCLPALVAPRAVPVTIVPVTAVPVTAVPIAVATAVARVADAKRMHVVALQA